MSERKLRDAIDRMVEQSIRRILPQVMNEVLLATLSSSMLREERVPTVAPPRRSAPVSRAVRPKPSRQPPQSLRDRLNEFVDDSAGRDFYDRLELDDDLPTHDPVEPDHDQFDDSDDEPVREQISTRKMSPMLQRLAEDVHIPDNFDDESSAGGDSIDHVAAAKHLGIDFKRLSRTINKVENKPTGDARAQQEFEDRRLRNMREQLAAQKVS